MIGACFDSAQNASQDPFNKASRNHAPGEACWCVAVGRAGDQTCSHLAHHADKRLNVISVLGWCGEGPDAAIEIPGVFALGCHFGVHLSQRCCWKQQAKCQQVKELFHRSTVLNR